MAIYVSGLVLIAKAVFVNDVPKMAVFVVHLNVRLTNFVLMLFVAQFIAMKIMIAIIVARWQLAVQAAARL